MLKIMDKLGKVFAFLRDGDTAPVSVKEEVTCDDTCASKKKKQVARKRRAIKAKGKE